MVNVQPTAVLAKIVYAAVVYSLKIFTIGWFVVYDRGMGILSLRSYVHEEYWLKIQDGQPQRKVLLLYCQFAVVNKFAL